MKMNLIPDEIMDTGDYYCTWATQARVRPADIADDSLDVRNNLNEEFLFGKNGVLSEYFQHIRGDLTVLLDDGWDVRWEPKTPKTAGASARLCSIPDVSRILRAVEPSAFLQ